MSTEENALALLATLDLEQLRQLADLCSIVYEAGFDHGNGIGNQLDRLDEGDERKPLQQIVKLAKADRQRRMEELYSTDSEQPADPHVALGEQPADPHVALDEQPADPHVALDEQPADPHVALSEQPADPYVALGEQPADPYVALGEQKQKLSGL